MGKLNSGQLQERVVLLTAGASVSDGRGGFLPSAPDTETTVWARVRPLSTSEKLQLGQVLNANAYEVTIRKINAVSAKQRVLWKGQTLNVQAVTEDENREFQLLICLNSGQ
jgi:SPP1 family predicted phage head-tail adaptor